jgi:broad specificity phosphatase PhoE
MAGFGATAEADANLVEWNYGDYEGLRTVQIHEKNPDWQLFGDGCPGGIIPTGHPVLGRHPACDRLNRWRNRV